MRLIGKLSVTICIMMLSLSGCNLLSLGEDAPKADEQQAPAKDTSAQKGATTDADGAAVDSTADADSGEKAPELDLTFPKLDPSIGPKLKKPKKVRSVRLYNDGMKFYRDKEFTDALESLQGAIAINPSNLLFRKDAACTLVQMDLLDAAVDLLKEMTITDECPRCHVVLADAWEDKCFAGVKREARFKSLIKPAFERVKKELDESTWVTTIPWRENSFRLKTDALPAKSEDGRNIALLRPQFENNDRRHPRVFFQVIDIETDIVKNSELIATPDEIRSLEADLKIEIIRDRVEKRIRDGHKMMLGWKWTTMPHSEVPPKYREKVKFGN